MARRQFRGDTRRYTVESDHPTLGFVVEPFPSARTAVVRARLHEREGADVVVTGPRGSMIYTTEDGVL